jgi:ssDNA-binding Zn-finger/Zn-ribbon topoisomerase 1
MSTPISLTREITPMCPKCGGKMHLIKGKRGDFLGCNNYPSCKGNRSLDRYDKIFDKSAYEDGGEAEEAFRNSYFDGDWSIFDTPE